MRSIVSYSVSSVVKTLVAAIVLYACCFAVVSDIVLVSIFQIIFILFLICGLFFAPTAVVADADYVTVSTIIWRHKIAIRDISRVELYHPTYDKIRILGSGGFLGYWGLFRAGDIGKYTAYYGNASECFLISMNDGHKYVIGCQCPDEMVGYIKSQLVKS